MKKGPEESKSCPYCMGEININATKCKYCGEELKEDKEGKRERLRREGEDSGKSEVRRQIQDKLKENKKSDSSGKPEAAQKSVSKGEGAKNWWAGQSTGFKALVVLCVGIFAIGGIYLASGTNQGTPNQITDQIIPSEQSTTIVSAETCPVCGGDGKVSCKNCDGTGKIKCKDCQGKGFKTTVDTKDNGTINLYIGCTTCGGDGSSGFENEITKGTGKVDCPECINGQIKCTKCGGDGKIGN